MSIFTDQAAIVGIGYTKFTQSAGVSNLSLAAEAALNAIQDAGLKTKQIHSVASYTRGDTPNQGVLETILGLEQLYWNWDGTPGGAYVADELIGMAAAATIQNLGDYAIVFHVVNRWANRNPMIGMQGLDTDAIWEERQFDWAASCPSIPTVATFPRRTGREWDTLLKGFDSYATSCPLTAR